MKYIHPILILSRKCRLAQRLITYLMHAYDEPVNLTPPPPPLNNDLMCYLRPKTLIKQVSSVVY